MNRAARPRSAGRRGRTLLVVAIAAAIASVALQVAIERARPTPVVVFNAQGTAGTALLLYHPGLSDLQERLTDAFASALVDAGWRVERTTTSRDAPGDLTGYDLLVLGVHTYYWAPDGPTRRFLARTDLNGIPTVALVSALGAAGRAVRVTGERIAAAGGEVVAVRPFFVLRPNDERDPRPNLEVALDAAYQLGVAAATR